VIAAISASSLGGRLFVAPTVSFVIATISSDRVGKRWSPQRIGGGLESTGGCRRIEQEVFDLILNDPHYRPETADLFAGGIHRGVELQVQVLYGITDPLDLMPYRFRDCGRISDDLVGAIEQWLGPRGQLFHHPLYPFEQAGDEC
jgi:hypothetical protein